MIAEKTLPATIDEYIIQFPKEIRAILEELRQTIKNAAPEAEEKISYQMPCFTLKGNLVYFAVFKNHIGFYPTGSGIEKFKNELTGFKFSKGAIQFPLNELLPLDLVTRIVKFRVKDNMEKAEKNRRKKS
jgi:uncharacterized protein YdhG (YjbR/CyaY superfamily)